MSEMLSESQCPVEHDISFLQSLRVLKLLLSGKTPKSIKILPEAP